MKEAPNFSSEITTDINPQTPASSIFELPFHLRRRTLKQIRMENGRLPERLWNERGQAVETRVQLILGSQKNIVKSVVMNPPYTKDSDLTLKLIDGLELNVDVKSSHLGIRDRKHKIRDLLMTEEDNGQLIGPWTKKLAMAEWNRLSNNAKELAISGWLTRNKIILINGGEEDLKEKTPEEILNDSFYPQLKRIQKMVSEKQKS